MDVNGWLTDELKDVPPERRMRIKKCARAILDNWYEWEAGAGSLAQIEQSHEVFEFEMLKRICHVLRGV